MMSQKKDPTGCGSSGGVGATDQLDAVDPGNNANAQARQRLEHFGDDGASGAAP